MTEVLVGTLAELPTETGVRIDCDGTSVAVFRVDDAVYAVADTCSHAEASLAEGELFDGEVECPRHGAMFDVTTGEALSLPATKPVRTYRTEIRDGQVFVGLQDEEHDNGVDDDE